VRQRFVSDTDLQPRQDSMTDLNRRYLLATLGVGLMAAGSAVATSPSENIAQRLTLAQQDGKVDGLHTLLVSQGGRLVTEHYERGEWDELTIPYGDPRNSENAMEVAPDRNSSRPASGSGRRSTLVGRT
jgi:hypothetical protein